mgnify:FL=1
MTRRRTLLVGVGIVALLGAVAAVLLYRPADRAPSGCDTVRALISYNEQFAGQMKSSADSDNAVAVTPDQYREWAARVKDYAGQISNPDLSGKAGTAADLAGRLADLVPRYRAKPDDAATARDYAGLGIEYGNAINRLEYSCLPSG